jgi:hypothetical protein
MFMKLMKKIMLILRDNDKWDIFYRYNANNDYYFFVNNTKERQTIVYTATTIEI